MVGGRTGRHKVERSAGMVQQVMPGWSWEEGFDAPQRAQLTHRIVGELDARLPSAEPGSGSAVTVGLQQIVRTQHPPEPGHGTCQGDQIA